MKTPKHRMVIELEFPDRDQLEAVAKHYGASMRGTVARYVREGLTRDEHRIIGKGDPR